MVSKSTQELAEKIFKPDKIEEALRALEAYPGYDDFPRDSMHKNVLRRSNGDLLALKVLVEVVTDNPRDLLNVDPTRHEKYIDEKVREYAAGFFKPEELNDVVKILHGYSHAAGDEFKIKEIKTAIVNLSQGNMDKLKFYLTEANKDYLHVLGLLEKNKTEDLAKKCFKPDQLQEALRILGTCHNQSYSILQLERFKRNAISWSKGNVDKLKSSIETGPTDPWDLV